MMRCKSTERMSRNSKTSLQSTSAPISTQMWTNKKSLKNLMMLSTMFTLLRSGSGSPLPSSVLKSSPSAVQLAALATATTTRNVMLSLLELRKLSLRRVKWSRNAEDQAPQAAPTTQTKRTKRRNKSMILKPVSFRSKLKSLPLRSSQTSTLVPIKCHINNNLSSKLSTTQPLAARLSDSLSIMANLKTSEYLKTLKSTLRFTKILLHSH